MRHGMQTLFGCPAATVLSAHEALRRYFRGYRAVALSATVEAGGSRRQGGRAGRNRGFR